MQTVIKWMLFPKHTGLKIIFVRRWQRVRQWQSEEVSFVLLLISIITGTSPVWSCSVLFEFSISFRSYKTSGSSSISSEASSEEAGDQEMAAASSSENSSSESSWTPAIKWIFNHWRCRSFSLIVLVIYDFKVTLMNKRSKINCLMMSCHLLWLIGN